MQLNARHNVGAKGQVAPTLAASSAASGAAAPAIRTPAAMTASLEGDTQIDPSATTSDSAIAVTSTEPALAAASASSPQPC
eukprot:138815-Amphidinium_carterae.1